MDIPHSQLHRYPEETPGQRGIARLKRAFTRPVNGSCTEEDGADIREIFSRLLLFANIFTPLSAGEEKENLDRMLTRTGLVLERSDCLILERCQIGNSHITIARCSLEYRNEDEAGERTVYLEGNLSMQTDHLGQVSISISAKPWTSTGIEPISSGSPGEEPVPARNLS